MASKLASCLYCDRTSDQVPLINMYFKGKETWICPQHLPMLIHKPAQLANKLPGLEAVEPPEGHEND